MGIFKEAKVELIAKAARKAAEEGRGVFTPRLGFPSTHPGGTNPVDDWALMVEAIEAEGWALAHWAVGMDPKTQGAAYPLFRRA